MAPRTTSRTTTKKTQAQKTAAKKAAAAKKRGSAPKSAAQLSAEKRLADKAKELGIDESIAAAADMEVTTAEGWKGRRESVKLLLPSGNVVKAVNKGLMAFVQAGKIPNALMPMVLEGIRSGQGLPPEKAAAAIEADPTVLRDMFAMQTIIVAECIVEPKFHEPPYQTKPGEDGKPELVLDSEGLPKVDEDAKDSNLLYLDEMDFMDRNFVFNWVMGGTRDLERFREEQTAYVAGLSEGGAVGEEA